MSDVLDALLESPRLEESTTSRERWAKWELTHKAVQALGVGDSHRVDRGFSVHRITAKGDRQFRVTMKGPSGGPNAGDRHVYVGTPAQATDTAHGVTASERRRAIHDKTYRETLKAMKRKGGGVGTSRGFSGSQIAHAKGVARRAAMGESEASIELLIDPLTEAADSLAKASTPEPFSTSRTSNWVARGGGLPAYIQHIAHDLMEKRGKSESNAIQMAIGIVKNWASGKGKVDANTRAAAAKAVAEWERLKAGSHAKAAVQHSELSVTERLAMAEDAERRLYNVAQAIGVSGLWELLLPIEGCSERAFSAEQRKKLADKGHAMKDGSFPIANKQDLENAKQAIGRAPEGKRAAVKAHIRKRAKALGLAEAEAGPLKLKCPKCSTVQAASNKTCTNCGHDLTDARKAKMAKLNEAAAPHFCTCSAAASAKGKCPKCGVPKAPSPPKAKVAEAESSPSVELKRTASSNSESVRHEVHMDGQHVGYVAERPGYSPREPSRHEAITLNGERVGSPVGSQKDAVGSLRKHLEEAPARVAPGPGGKFLVAKHPSYGGQPTYTEYPGEESARHAAGLPPKATAIEKASNVKALGEAVAADLALVESFAPTRYAELWGPMLRGRREGGRSVPFSASN